MCACACVLDVDGRVKRRYHACLEKEAALRLRMMRSVDAQEAKQIVKDVFRPCRYDLEPFGQEPKLTPKTISTLVKNKFIECFRVFFSLL